MVKISPSILAADFSRMGEEVKSARDAGVDMLHIDVMDGHFVPNLTMGPDMLKAVKNSVDLYAGVHLMVTNPENFFEPFAHAGADLLTFHIEIDPDPTAKIRMVRGLNCQVGLSLNPDRPVEDVLPFLEKVDLVLLMSVFPGFAGQKFIEASLERTATLRKFIDDKRLNCQIEVDGGVDRITGPKLIRAGADILVMGSAFFHEKDRSGLVKALKSV